MSDLALGVVLLFTEDFDAAVDFYTGAGLTKADDDPGTGYRRGVDFQALTTGGTLLEVFDSKVHQSPTPGQRTSTVLAFRTEDLAAAMKDLVARGAEVVEDVIERDWGSYAYLRHPAGPTFQVYAERPSS